MRPFIQAKGDMLGNVNFSAAYWGFAEMGFECVLFRSIEELDASSRGDVVVGGLGPVRHALVSRGVRIEEFDYPDELRGYMGRRNLYAQLLAARWAELTETPDECDFR